MNITRRTALAGAAGGMIGVLPIAAQSTSASPFLTIADDTAALIRVLYGEPSAPSKEGYRDIYQGRSGNLLRIFPMEVDPVDGIMVNSIEAAEDTVLAEIGSPYAVFDPARIAGPDVYSGDIHAAFPVMLNRQANLIAARTRLGAGNLVLVPPNGLNILVSASTAAFSKSTTDQSRQMGRWRHAGMLNQSMDVWVGDHLPMNCAYVVYAPQSGYGHAVVVRTASGLYLHMAKSTSKTLGNMADYFGSVGIIQTETV